MDVKGHLSISQPRLWDKSTQQREGRESFLIVYISCTFTMHTKPFFVVQLQSRPCSNYWNIKVLEKAQAQKIDVTEVSAHIGQGLALHPRILYEQSTKRKRKSNFGYLFLRLSLSVSFAPKFQWNSTWEIPSFDTLTALVCVVQDNQWILKQSPTCNYKGN